ncbi:hypothetical protein BDQ17DRAFT_827117 [Cyathus striatus]|nr:hypothetical protein BDQ17DRAFT_827117 [Cyathus striatus]
MGFGHMALNLEITKRLGLCIVVYELVCTVFCTSTFAHATSLVIPSTPSKFKSCTRCPQCIQHPPTPFLHCRPHPLTMFEVVCLLCGKHWSRENRI